MANTSLRDNVTNTHPEYADLNAQCESVHAAYECAEGLFSEAYIHRHVFEDQKQYTKRISRAFTLSFMQNSIRKLVDSMFSRAVMRQGEDLSFLRPFFQDATGTNVGYDQFIRTLFAGSLLYGRAHVLVDYGQPEISKDLVKVFKNIPGTTPEDVPQPNLRLFTPMTMTNWNFIPRYGYEACVFSVPKLVEGQMKNWYLYVDYDTIEEFNESGESQGAYTHSLGYTPVFTLLNYDVNGAPMAFSNVLYRAQLAVTNICSITDEIAERHAFSQLICPDDGTFAELAAKESDYLQQWARVNATPGEIIDGSADLGMDRVLRSMSQSSVFTFPANTGHPPNFISPDATQLGTVWKIAREIVRETSVQLGLFDENGNVHAATSVPFLSGMADAMTGLERKIIGTALRFMNVDSDQYTVLYPEFSAPPDYSWMDTADRLATCTWLGAEAKVELITALLQANAKTLPVVNRDVLATAVELAPVVPPVANAAGGNQNTVDNDNT